MVLSIKHNIARSWTWKNISLYKLYNILIIRKETEKKKTRQKKDYNSKFLTQLFLYFFLLKPESF